MKPIPPVSAPMAPPVHGDAPPLSWVMDEAFRQNRTVIIQKLYPLIASKRAHALPLVDLVKVAGISEAEFVQLTDVRLTKKAAVGLVKKRTSEEEDPKNLRWYERRVYRRSMPSEAASIDTSPRHASRRGWLLVLCLAMGGTGKLRGWPESRACRCGGGAPLQVHKATCAQKHKT